MDSVLTNIIDPDNPCQLSAKPIENLFPTLLTSIIGQQLSAKAASTINGRVKALFTEITPEVILATEPEQFRQAGVSAAKIRYIRVLAERVQ